METLLGGDRWNDNEYEDTCWSWGESSDEKKCEEDDALGGIGIGFKGDRNG